MSSLLYSSLQAVQRGHVEIATYLAAFGADVQRTTFHGHNALILAREDPLMLEYVKTIWNWKPMQVCNMRKELNDTRPSTQPVLVDRMRGAHG